MNREKLKNSLKVEEGVRLYVYFDTEGIPTIGIGRNLKDKGISMATAMQMLEEDLDEVENDLKTFPWWNSLDDVRQRVLADMRFNLGPSRFRSFKNTLRAVQEGRFRDASKGMLASKWAKQTKTRATKLAKMMETGQDG